jgi:hypothetical protein
MAFYNTQNLLNFSITSGEKNSGQSLQMLRNGFDQKIEVDAGSGVDIVYATEDLLSGWIIRTPDLFEDTSIDFTEDADTMIEKIKAKVRSLAGPNFPIHAGFSFDFAIYCENPDAAIEIYGGTGVKLGFTGDFGLVLPDAVSWFRCTVAAIVDDGAEFNEIYISQLSGRDFLPFLSPTSLVNKDEFKAKRQAKRTKLGLH